jgi:nuclear GTP-binding protein
MSKRKDSMKSKRSKSDSSGKPSRSPPSIVKRGNAVPSKPKVKGENFYHDAKKVAYLNMLRGGAPVRNDKGKIIKPAEYANWKPENPVVRVDSNRKWFGNTRTMNADTLEKLRVEMEKKLHDPYQVLLHQNKLPMSLLTESKKIAKMNLLEVESFSDTFGKKASRRKPKLIGCSMEDLVEKANEAEQVFSTLTSTNAGQPDSLTNEEEKEAGIFPLAQDQVFKKGQSKRIWNELYKVIDSSDVVVHVLDARDPLGTRCPRVEAFIEKEAKHKHLLFLLNKCDLIPPSITSKWVQLLSKERPTLAFHASINNSFGKGSLIHLLRQYSKLHPERKQISVGFIGYPNTGKSSIINTLRKKKVCTVAPIPGQTKVNLMYLYENTF